jgi:hypothetical protein
MNNPRSFSIDGLAPPLSALHEFEQSYAPLAQVRVQRKMSGRGFIQQTWGGKLKTTLRGGGWLPAGIAALATEFPRLPHSLSCAVSLDLQSATTAIALPVGRRMEAEYAPRGYALLADGRSVATPGALANDILTLTPVTGAVNYQAVYWPVLSVFLTSITRRHDLRGNVTGWEIQAEEV